MATILTKYYPATNYKGSRIKVWKPNGPKAKFYPFPFDAFDACLWAAKKYAEEVLGWKGGFVEGIVDNDTQVYVLKEPDFTRDELVSLLRALDCGISPEDEETLRVKIRGMLK